jgi:hypothetical protein
MKRKHWALLLAALVFSLLAITQGWTTARENAKGDSDFLLSLSQPLMAADKRMVIKHTSPYRNCSSDTDFLHATQELSHTFQPLGLSTFNEDSPNLDQDEELRTSKFTLAYSGELQATLLLVGFPDGHTVLSLTAETMQEQGLPQLRILQKQWTAALQALGIPPHWNVMVQGTLSASIADAQSLLQLLSVTTPLQELARYQDVGSLSISYHSSLLPLPQHTGTEKMNLQVAVHRNSITDQQRLTIASPAISIEY